MCSPSALIKVNYLVIRHLHFGSVLGDLQEGNGCASRCQFTLFSSTKSGFLCFFGLRNPRFRAFRAQNRGFCALVAVGTPFSGFSSTKSRFLCAFGQYFLGFSPRRAQNLGFCVLFPEKVGFAGCGNLIANPADVATWLVLLPGVLICLVLLPSVLI